MKNLLKIALLLFLVSNQAGAQSANAPFSDPYYHWIDRWEIITGTQQEMFHTTFKPYQRKFIGEFLQEIVESPAIRGTERTMLDYLKQDNWEWIDEMDYASRKPFLQYFYRSKSDFYHVKTPSFDLHINQIIHFSYGRDFKNGLPTYLNTRGIRVRGMIDEKIGFYSSITENQMRVPEYIREFSGSNVLPHVGFFKGFKEGGYDFFEARGYLSVNATKHVNVQLGHDNFHIGNGYRSMILSDFVPPYFFLKLETRVWKLQYTNLFSQMLTNRIRGAHLGTGHPNKYSVFHHLSVDIGKKLNVGLFESVIIGGTDSTDADLEWEYLNPIIFYRAIEQQNGSSYNALVGADFQWLPFKGISLYGQLMLDEFVLSHLKAGDGWWGNKFGIQAGAKWINAFKVPTLDLQGELNLARPFTYTHYNTANSYSHYLQPLAHPLGANFKEMLFILRFQPINKLFTEVRLINAVKGQDRNGENWGGNILLDYTTRTGPDPANPTFGHKIGQGVEQNIRLMVVQASYMLKHNLFLDATFTLRNADAAESEFSGTTTWLNGGLRWNIFPKAYDF